MRAGPLRLLPLLLAASNCIAAKPGLLCSHADTCLETGTTPELNAAFETIARQLQWSTLSESARKCFTGYTRRPRRSLFFSRITRPPHIPPERFGGMLARGGIHPRGVVLDSEFYTLPFQFNATAVRSELRALEPKWHSSTKGNAEQGVVSSFFRVSEGAEDLKGPFRQVNKRLDLSPNIRALLNSFRSVIGNAGFLRLAPGETVDMHFDTSPYWYPRVRVHCPVQTNDQVLFECGQLGEAVSLHMEEGQCYLFDNHLGHSVRNSGSTDRLHLTIDLVGSRYFWQQVSLSKAHGSGSLAQPELRERIVVPLVNKSSGVPSVLLEGWNDSDLQHKALVITLSNAIASTWPAVNAQAMLQIVDAWSANTKDRPRHEQVVLLQLLAAYSDCESTSNSQLGPTLSLRDVVDSISEVLAIDEAPNEIKPIGGEAA